MQLTSSTYVFLLANLVSQILTCASGFPALHAGPTEQISAEDYWYYDKVGLLKDVRLSADDVTGQRFSRHGWVPFHIQRVLLNDTVAKTLGARRAVQELVVRATLSSGQEARRRAEEQLTALTGISQEGADWETWLATNREYLVWCDRENRLMIDEEAKKLGIPALDHRKAPQEGAKGTIGRL